MFSFFRRKKKQETPEPVEQGQNEAAAAEAAAGQPDQEERPSENTAEEAVGSEKLADNAMPSETELSFRRHFYFNPFESLRKIQFAAFANSILIASITAL